MNTYAFVYFRDIVRIGSKSSRSSRILRLTFYSGSYLDHLPIPPISLSSALLASPVIALQPVNHARKLLRSYLTIMSGWRAMPRIRTGRWIAILMAPSVSA